MFLAVFTLNLHCAFLDPQRRHWHRFFLNFWLQNLPFLDQTATLTSNNEQPKAMSFCQCDQLQACFSCFSRTLSPATGFSQYLDKLKIRYHLYTTSTRVDIIRMERNCLLKTFLFSMNLFSCRPDHRLQSSSFDDVTYKGWDGYIFHARLPNP